MLMPLIYAVLMGLTLFLISLYFSRMAHQMNRHGYVPGSVLITSLPGLMTLVGYGLLSAKLLPANWLDINLIFLAISFLLGLLIGLFAELRADKARTK